MKETIKAYESRMHGEATKRYCRTLTLRDDAGLIATYRDRHAEGNVWPEVLEGIRSVGILEMEIYIRGNQLFMIVETPLDFDWESAMERLGTLPRQQEWEDYMTLFQQSEVGTSPADKWQPMERMFHLY